MVFILLIVAFSYAYYVSNISNTANLSYDLNTTVNNVVLNINGNAVINATISDFDMFGQSYDVNAMDEKDPIVLSINNEDGIPLKCTYDITWSWDASSDAYAKSPGSANEFVVSLANSYGSGYIANKNEIEVPSSYKSKCTAIVRFQI